MGDLLDEDFSLVEKNALYRCLDKVLGHKEELFGHLRQRWQDLFGARFDVLLYDLTSTYFESDPPLEETDKRQFGYSRDKRSDCVQVIIGLIVTPEGFPLAYEVLPGNTSDKTTLRKFLRKIEERYGKAERIWLMDRGVPTEEVLSEMRSSSPVPIYYLVGTPKGRLSKLEAELLPRPWQRVRPGVEVKVLPQENELYIFAQSQDRLKKERAMRQRQLKALWRRLGQLQRMKLTARELLLKLGEAKGRYRAGWRFMDIQFPTPTTKGIASFSFALNRQKLRIIRRREGRYLLRTKSLGRDPAQLWQFYIQLVEIEAAFKNLKDDLALRPIFHQLERRIEAHIFVAFLVNRQGDLASPVASAGTRPDSTCRSGQVCCHPDARCTLRRRAHSDFKPLHPSRTGAKNPARTAQAHAAGPTTPAHQLSSKALRSEIKHHSCSADLLTMMSIWSAFPGHEPLE